MGGEGEEEVGRREEEGKRGENEGKFAPNRKIVPAPTTKIVAGMCMHVNRTARVHQFV